MPKGTTGQVQSIWVHFRSEVTLKVVGIHQAGWTGEDPREQGKRQCPNGEEPKLRMSTGGESGQRGGL